MNTILDDFTIDELEPGEFKERLIANIIDYAIIGLIIFLLNGTFHIGIFASAILLWLYFSLQNSSAKQATFGKQIMGLVLADINGNRLNFVSASYRLIVKVVSSALVFNFITVRNNRYFQDRFKTTIVLIK